jgi:2,4-dienoyl-CoA reductase-like NADH-dependent reductase (Old Yellow Enzyme family)
MWNGGAHLPPDSGGYQTVAPSPIAFAGLPVPQELSAGQIELLVEAFGQAASRAVRCGFDLIELHAAHGYLVHQFLSPLSNKRSDSYGGTLENRCRFPLAAISAMRDSVPAERALMIRISATDWMPGGWDLEQSEQFVAWARQRGLDHVDVSTGALVAEAKIPVGPCHQAPFAGAIRRSAALTVNTVGMIETAEQAEKLLQDCLTDAVMLGRPMLRDPHTATKWATQLGGEAADWCPPQYAAAGWRRAYAPPS